MTTHPWEKKGKKGKEVRGSGGNGAQVTDGSLFANVEKSAT